MAALIKLSNLLKRGLQQGYVSAAPCLKQQQAVPRRLSRRHGLCCKALHIDRRAHLELAWQRQHEREATLERLVTGAAEHGGQVLEVQDLQQLEAVCSTAGSSMVCLFLYSRTCGVCKEAAQRFEDLRRGVQSSQARIILVKHDINTEFDDPSDIARFHKVKAVPAFLFIDDGAVVRRLSLRDIRRLTGPAAMVQAAVAEDFRRLKATFLEVLLSRAPSARS